MHRSPLPWRIPGAVLFYASALVSSLRADEPLTPLAPPPQSAGLPYTRSAAAPALAKILDGVAVFPGSRYGYLRGVRVRLDERDLLHAPAVEREGVVYVPHAFAALIGLKAVVPPPVPVELGPIADRWVYAPHELRPDAATAPLPEGVRSLRVRETEYVGLEDVARAAGLTLTRHPRGLVYLGSAPLTFAPGEETLLDSVIALFDTPDQLADPDIATRSIPNLARQGKWTEHVKVTPEQLAVLSGPEAEWPTAPKSAYREEGINTTLLGSKLPPPGVYPRLLFSADDVTMLSERVKATISGRRSLAEMEALLQQSFWDPTTSDGAVFQKLAAGELGGLEWDVPPGQPAFTALHRFKGQREGIYSSHVAYVPECLTSMALYCLLTHDETHGRQAAAAIANYYRLREPLIDEWLKISDSEFGSSYRMPDGSLFELNALGARTHWRNIHGLVAHMNLGLALDLAGCWMTADDKDLMRRVIAKATYGRRSYAQDGPVRFRDVNWMSWDLPHFIAVASIEGLPGFDAEAYASGAESVRAFCDWGVDDAGVIFESTGKNPGALQFQLLSMVILARRGDNLLGHPHWSRLVEASIQMLSPTGKVMVNSGTQYSPYSRQKLSRMLMPEWKSFYPKNRLPDYWLTTMRDEAADDASWVGFTPEESPRPVVTKRLRLPGLSYPGMARNVLYDSDVQPTTRAELNLPLDFTAPYQGVFSSYSDRTPEAAWMHLYVRPHHYLGAGHHHADAGMFHFAALGVDWFTQSPFPKAYDGNYFNLVQVDGRSEAATLPDGQLGSRGMGLAYNAAATYLGATTGAEASIGSADLTYAYSWRWMTQPPQVWSPALESLGWELDPSPENLRNWAGTARYKLRPWWANYTYSNYIPTCRAPFNPMQRVFRSTALVRGAHPYGVVVDDVQKDDATRLYQWVAMLNGGVWKAELPGLPPNQIALAYRPGDPDSKSAAAPDTLVPKPGEPLLLVCALGMDASGMPDRPLLEVERLPGVLEKSTGNAPEQPLYYNRIAIQQRAASAAFRVLLLPVRAGSPMPRIAYDAAAQVATVRWGNQTDRLQFQLGNDQRTRLAIERDGKPILAPQP
jgi:hypothetical protein